MLQYCKLRAILHCVVLTSRWLRVYLHRRTDNSTYRQSHHIFSGGRLSAVSANTIYMYNKLTVDFVLEICEPSWPWPLTPWCWLGVSLYHYSVSQQSSLHFWRHFSFMVNMCNRNFLSCCPTIPYNCYQFYPELCDAAATSTLLHVLSCAGISSL